MSERIIRSFVWIQTIGVRDPAGPRGRSPAHRLLRRDDGQTVAEYALVLLVVAAIAVAFLLWARQSGKLDSFFDAIFAKLVESVDPDATPAPSQ